MVHIVSFVCPLYSRDRILFLSYLEHLILYQLHMVVVSHGGFEQLLTERVLGLLGLQVWCPCVARRRRRRSTGSVWAALSIKFASKTRSSLSLATCPSEYIMTSCLSQPATTQGTETCEHTHTQTCPELRGVFSTCSPPCPPPSALSSPPSLSDSEGKAKEKGPL